MIDWQVVTLKLARHYGAQTRLADAAGMHRRSISKLATGQSETPSFSHAVRLLELYSEHVEPLPGARELAGLARRGGK